MHLQSGSWTCVGKGFKAVRTCKVRKAEGDGNQDEGTFGSDTLGYATGHFHVLALLADAACFPSPMD